jgi:enediyne biosynthesis protein E4
LFYNRTGMILSRRELLWLTVALGASKGMRVLGKGTPAPPLFQEIPPSASGIVWAHDNARSEEHYLPETLGPGVAFLDYDNDGWMDIYLVNSGSCDFWTPPKPIRNALYKNNRDGTFTDVTEKAGVSGGTFGMGVAVGDYDNDGWPDIFVTSYGSCILYKNNHDGTFTDVTEKSGLASPGWTTSAVWFDYDNDGRLDLFACSFVDYGAKHKFECGNNKLGRHFYCIPRVFNGTPSFLYHNNGDGTFTEASAGTDIAKTMGKGLGVVATDVNNDGRMDLFVSNDTVPNFLYMNRGPDAKGKIRWEEIGLQASVAFSDNGQARSGMGVDAGDLNNNGWQDLFVANVDQEMFSLYKNNKDESFTDQAYAHGVAQATRLLSGWGLKYFDYDNDGAVDLILANGHPDDMIDTFSRQVHYKESPLLFHQGPDGKLVNVTPEAGPTFEQAFPSRGLAVGDYNNDGALDVIIANNGGPPVLLKNNAAQGNNWLGVILEGSTCNRDAVGAQILWKSGDKLHHRMKNSGGSYLSSHDPREVLGIGAAAKIDELEIRWPLPSKRVDKFTDLAPNGYVRIVEGKGIVQE